jgi:predicted RND superfamily exporter protein
MNESEWAVAAGVVLVAVLLTAIAARPERVIAHARAVLVLLGLVSLAAAAALVDVPGQRLRIELDASEEPLMLSGDPARAIYEQATRTFGNDDVYVIAMITPDVFTAEDLGALRRISHALLALPGVRRAESLVDINAYRYDATHDWIDITPFIQEIPTDAAELAELRRRALVDPIYPDLIVSDDGRAAAINLSFRKLSDREFIRGELDERIRAIALAESTPERRFHFTGRPHVKARTYHVMVWDLVRLIPLSVAMAALVVFAMTGSPRGVALPLLACLTATLWTFGLLAVLAVPLNLITIVLGPILISLGGLYGVHVMGRYEVECEATSDPAAVALATLRYTRLPVVMAGATTCVGFGALLLAEIPGTGELGLFALFGIACLTLITLAGIPAALARLPRGHGQLGRGGLARRFGRQLDTALSGVADFCCLHSTGVLVAWAVIFVIAVAAIPRIVIDTDYLTFFDEASLVRRDFAAVREELIGPVPIYVQLLGDEEGVFREPANLRLLERLQAEVDAVPGVSASISVADILRQLNRAMERDDPAKEVIPDEREAVSDLVFLVPKAQMRRFANSNHSAANLLVRTGELGSRAIRGLVSRLEEATLRVGFPSHIRPVITGNAVVLNRSADALASSQASSVGFAAVTIFAGIAWVFGSLRVGAIAMIPNLVPVIVFFGVLGFGIAPLSLPTSLIGSVTLGVAIDDTVHFLVGYRRQRADGASPEDAVRRTARRVGRPIVITSVMLVAGFLTITLSGFATIREFGILTALTMGICLSTDLVLLPALLVRTRA